MEQVPWQKKQYDRQDREHDKLAKHLSRLAGQAIADFNMIEEGDRIMVCVSGGTNSLAMLEILMRALRVAPVNFSLIEVNLDQKQPGFPADILSAWFEPLGVENPIVEEISMPVPKSLVPQKSPWAIIETICWQPFFSTCSTVAP